MTTLKQIDKKIATFSTNRKRLQLLGHEIAMLILNHAAPSAAGPNAEGTGDCTRALKLAKEMPKSWQVQLQNWFTLYSPIRVVAKNDKCEYAPEYKKTVDNKPVLSAEEKLTWWKLEEAAQTPFFDLEEPDATVTLLDFAAMVKMIEQMTKKVENRIEKGEVKPDDVPSAQAFVAQLSALKLARVAPANEDSAAPSGTAAAA